MRVSAVALAALCAVYLHSHALALDADGEAYDVAIATAVEHYRRKDWSNARAAFERAHELRPSARTFRGLGLSAYYAHDLVAAATALQSSLDETRNLLDGEQRAQVIELLERIRLRVAQVHINAKPATVAIQVDGAAVADGQGLFVLPGRHTLLVSAAGFVDYREDFEVSGGQRMSLRVVLEPRKALAPPSAVAHAPKRAPPAAFTRPEVRSGGPTLAPWIVAGASAAMALATLGFAIATQDELDDLQDRCARMGCTPEVRDRLWSASPIETYETLTNVALAAALTGTAASITLFLTLDSSDEASAQSSRAARVAVAGARVSGRF